MQRWITPGRAIALTAALIASMVVTPMLAPSPGRGLPPLQVASYAGGNYVLPSANVTGCELSSTQIYWNWLEDSCWNTSSQSPYHLSASTLFSNEMARVKAGGLGTLQHVWISLDQLFEPAPQMAYSGTVPISQTQAYTSYNADALANVDSMLSALHADGMTADLTLFVYDNLNRPGYWNPAALDGNHQALRSGYIQAVSDFLTHLRNNATDAATVQIVDLQEESYLQVEWYMCIPGGGYAGTSNCSHTAGTHPNTGYWNNPEPAFSSSPTSDYQKCETPGNTVCSLNNAKGYGCLTSTGSVDNYCVDVNITYAWMHDVYQAAIAAAPGFVYTWSDTLRMVVPATNANPLLTQAREMAFFIPNEDIIDEHYYVYQPWVTTSGAGATHPYTAVLALARAQPVIADAVGCNDGGSGVPANCTYTPADNNATLAWDLTNLSAEGVRLILTDDSAANLWTYTGSSPPTLVYNTTVDTDLFATYARQHFG